MLIVGHVYGSTPLGFARADYHPKCHVLVFLNLLSIAINSLKYQ